MQNSWMPTKGKARLGAPVWFCLNPPAPDGYNLRTQLLTLVPKGHIKKALCQVSAFLGDNLLVFGAFTNASLASLA